VSLFLSYRLMFAGLLDLSQGGLATRTNGMQRPGEANDLSARVEAWQGRAGCERVQKRVQVANRAAHR
jgi:hypothetical protein